MKKKWPPKQCAGLAKGQPCRGKAKKGSVMCGPHQGQRPRTLRKADEMPLVVPCPACGLEVPRARKLISYHFFVNGCDRSSL